MFQTLYIMIQLMSTMKASEDRHHIQYLPECKGKHNNCHTCRNYSDLLRLLLEQRRSFVQVILLSPLSAAVGLSLTIPLSLVVDSKSFDEDVPSTSVGPQVQSLLFTVSKVFICSAQHSCLQLLCSLVGTRECISHTDSYPATITAVTISTWKRKPK